MDLKKYIRSIPDYPKKGILFRDITTLIKNKDAFRECIDQMSKILNKLNYDKIAAIGIRISKWIAYHGFSINVINNLKNYNKIIPCGIKDKGVINLKLFKDQNYDQLSNKIIKNFIKNLET